jgi:hypothetical protein
MFWKNPEELFGNVTFGELESFGKVHVAFGEGQVWFCLVW